MPEKDKHLGKFLGPEKRDGDQFPVGMRVLAIDANVCSLKYLVTLLENCRYKVTATTEAAEALQILRSNKDEYDIVVTNVIREDMDGFKLLEIISLEMDIPVVMVSGNDDVVNIMRGISHGARGYLLKPVRLQEMMNLWQHVFRKNCDNPEKSSITRETTYQNSWPPKRVKDRTKEQEDETNTQSDSVSSTRKKQRLIWTNDLHLKFVDAFQELRNGEAVPNKILKTMNVPGLSRENVASHLQKYRNLLKKKKTEMSPKKELDLNLCGTNPDNKKGCGAAYGTTRPEVHGNVNGTDHVLKKSEPFSSSLMNLKPNNPQPQPRQLDLLQQYYAQPPDFTGQWMMHNLVYGNPPTPTPTPIPTPFPTNNYPPPVPDFKLLKFPPLSSSSSSSSSPQPFCFSVREQAGPSSSRPLYPYPSAVIYPPPSQMLGDPSTPMAAISQHASVTWPVQFFLPAGQHERISFFTPSDSGVTNLRGENMNCTNDMQGSSFTDLKGKGMAKSHELFPEQPEMIGSFHHYSGNSTDDDLSEMFNNDGPPKL